VAAWRRPRRPARKDYAWLPALPAPRGTEADTSAAFVSALHRPAPTGGARWSRPRGPLADYGERLNNANTTQASGNVTATPLEVSSSQDATAEGLALAAVDGWSHLPRSVAA
jgi:hypothetical protein